MQTFREWVLNEVEQEIVQQVDQVLTNYGSLLQPPWDLATVKQHAASNPANLKQIAQYFIDQGDNNSAQIMNMAMQAYHPNEAPIFIPGQTQAPAPPQPAAPTAQAPATSYQGIETGVKGGEFTGGKRGGMSAGREDWQTQVRRQQNQNQQ